tara:strand:+ start:679 stop:1050 length:372 start_codon:yes stop_codon:yes gene_type:complete
MTWEDILKENKFIIYAKNADRPDDYASDGSEHGSREAALTYLRNMFSQVGMTLVGSGKEGKIVEMDEDTGIFERLAGNILFYIITPKGEKPPSSNYRPDTTEADTGEGKLRQMRGDYRLSERY